MRAVWHFVVTGQESSFDRVSIHCSSLPPSPPSFLLLHELNTHSGPTAVLDDGNLFRQRNSPTQGQLESAYSPFLRLEWLLESKEGLLLPSLPLTRLTSSAIWGSFPDFFLFDYTLRLLGS